MPETLNHIVTRTQELGGRLAAQRLNRNLTQRQLADAAAVSINTLRRLEAGENVSLDALIRVMEALDLGDRLEALAPPADVRPVDRVRMAAANERRRATGDGAATGTPWTWGDDA